MNIKLDLIKYFSGLDSVGKSPKDIDSSLEYNNLSLFVKGNQKIKVDGKEYSFSDLKTSEQSKLQSVFDGMKNKHQAMSNSEDYALITDENVKQYADLLAQMEQTNGSGALDEAGHKDINKIKQSLNNYIMKNRPNTEDLDMNNINYSREIKNIVIGKLNMNKFKEMDSAEFKQQPKDYSYVVLNDSAKLCYYQGVYFCPEYPEIEANKNPYAVSRSINQHYQNDTINSLNDILKNNDYSEDKKKEMVRDLCEQFALNRYEMDCSPEGIAMNNIEPGPKNFKMVQYDANNNVTKKYSIPYEVTDNNGVKSAYFDKDAIYQYLMSQ